MKAILISIHPQWVELILNLIKKDEIRKGTAIGKAINRLIKEQGVAPMLIYCTKRSPWIYWNEGVAKLNNGQGCIRGYKSLRNDNGKVVARFNATAEEIICRPICGEWECYTKTQGYSEIAKASCLKNKEIVHYLKGKNGTAIRISNLEIFDKPKELKDFLTYSHTISGIGFKGEPKEFKVLKPLTRAPQSWQYIEV